MLDLLVARQVVLPISFVVAQFTGECVLFSVLPFPMPLEASPGAEDSLAGNAVVALSWLKVAGPVFKNNKFILQATFPNKFNFNPLQEMINLKRKLGNL